MTQAPVTPPVPAPGHATTVSSGTLIMGTYEIERLINSGGMGEVYRGHNIHNGEPVAIKIVLPSLAHDPKIVALFQKESTVLSRLSHEAIVRYHVFTNDPTIGRPCMVMEFVSGTAMSDRIEQGPMPLDDVKVMLRRVASGLDKAHRAGVVHRDLSPDNVILEEGAVEHAKLIDFGIAKSMALGAGTLLQGQFAGKFNWVSPEQLGAFGGVVDGRSDIYSLGLITAAASRGEVLAMGASIVDAVGKRAAVPDLAGVDPALVPLLAWMLQPDPAARPESMARVIAALDTPALVPQAVDPGPKAVDPNRTVIGGVLPIPEPQPVSVVPVSMPPALPIQPRTSAPVGATVIAPVQVQAPLEADDVSPFGAPTARPAVAVAAPNLSPMVAKKSNGGVVAVVALLALGGAAAGAYFGGVFQPAATPVAGETQDQADARAKADADAQALATQRAEAAAQAAKQAQADAEGKAAAEAEATKLAEAEAAAKLAAETEAAKATEAAVAAAQKATKDAAAKAADEAKAAEAKAAQEAADVAAKAEAEQAAAKLAADEAAAKATADAKLAEDAAAAQKAADEAVAKLAAENAAAQQAADEAAQKLADEAAAKAAEQAAAAQKAEADAAAQKAEADAAAQKAEADAAAQKAEADAAAQRAEQAAAAQKAEADAAAQKAADAAKFADPMATQLEYLAAYAAPACTLVTLTDAKASGFALNGYTADPASLAGFAKDWETGTLTKPDLTTRQITATQCPVLDFANRYPAPGLDPLSLQLPTIGEVVKSGDAGANIEGKIEGLEGRELALFLFSEGGGGRNLKPFLTKGADGSASFALNLSLPPGTPPAPQLLVAIVTDKPLPDLDKVPEGVTAQSLMPYLEKQLQQSGVTPTLGFGFFRLEN